MYVSSSNKKLLFSFLVNLILFITFYSFFHPIFLTNDDTMMFFVSSGVLTGHPSNFLMFTNVLAGSIIALMYKIISFLPWYSLNFIVTLYIISSLIFYVIAEKVKSYYSAMVIYLPMFIIMVSVFIYLLQFTIVSSLAITTGLSIVTYEFFIKEKSNKIALFIAILLTVWGSFIRFQSVFLSSTIWISSIIILLILKTYHLNKKNFKIKILGLFLIFVVIILGHWSNNFIYKNNALWKSYLTENKVKSQIIDYRILEQNPDIKKNILKSNEWSPTEYMLYRYRFLLDPNVSHIKYSVKTKIIKLKPVVSSEKILKNKTQYILNTYKKYLKVKKAWLAIISIFLSIFFIISIIKPAVKNYFSIFLMLLISIGLLITIGYLLKPPPIRVVYPAIISTFIILIIINPLRNIPISSFSLFLVFLITMSTSFLYAEKFYYFNRIVKNFNKIYDKLPSDKILIFWRSPGLVYIDPLKVYKHDKKIILTGLYIADYYRDFFTEKYSIKDAKDLIDNPQVILLTHGERGNIYLKRLYKYNYKVNVKFKRIYNNGFFKGFIILSKKTRK